jgi:glutaredoxin/glutathione-dependent peroxiredoxin
MAIGEGDRLPDATFVVMEPAGPAMRTTREIFDDKRVALFGLPGAYTPVCHKEHLPGIVALHDTLRQHGIDTVACTSVNDVFVLNRWSRDHAARGKVLMLADGNADFAIKAGLAVDLVEFGLGIRSNRYAMFVANGAVTVLSVEDVLSEHDKSSANSLCARIAVSA